MFSSVVPYVSVSSLAPRPPAITNKGKNTKFSAQITNTTLPLPSPSQLSPSSPSCVSCLSVSRPVHLFRPLSLPSSYQSRLLDHSLAIAAKAPNARNKAIKALESDIASDTISIDAVCQCSPLLRSLASALPHTGQTIKTILNSINDKALQIAAAQETGSPSAVFSSPGFCLSCWFNGLFTGALFELGQGASNANDNIHILHKVLPMMKLMWPSDGDAAVVQSHLARQFDAYISVLSLVDGLSVVLAADACAQQINWFVQYSTQHGLSLAPLSHSFVACVERLCVRVSFARSFPSSFARLVRSLRAVSPDCVAAVSAAVECLRSLEPIGPDTLASLSSAVRGVSFVSSASSVCARALAFAQRHSEDTEAQGLIIYLLTHKDPLIQSHLLHSLRVSIHGSSSCAYLFSPCLFSALFELLAAADQQEQGQQNKRDAIEVITLLHDKHESLFDAAFTARCASYLDIYLHSSDAASPLFERLAPTHANMFHSPLLPARLLFHRNSAIRVRAFQQAAVRVQHQLRYYLDHSPSHAQAAQFHAFIDALNAHQRTINKSLADIFAFDQLTVVRSRSPAVRSSTGGDAAAGLWSLYSREDSEPDLRVQCLNEILAIDERTPLLGLLSLADVSQSLLLAFRASSAFAEAAKPPAVASLVHSALLQGQLRLATRVVCELGQRADGDAELALLEIFDGVFPFVFHSQPRVRLVVAECLARIVFASRTCGLSQQRQDSEPSAFALPSSLLHCFQFPFPVSAPVEAPEAERNQRIAEYVRDILSQYDKLNIKTPIEITEHTEQTQPSQFAPLVDGILFDLSRACGHESFTSGLSSLRLLADLSPPIARALADYNFLPLFAPFLATAPANDADERMLTDILKFISALASARAHTGMNIGMPLKQLQTLSDSDGSHFDSVLVFILEQRFLANAHNGSPAYRTAFYGLALAFLRLAHARQHTGQAVSQQASALMAPLAAALVSELNQLTASPDCFNPALFSRVVCCLSEVACPRCHGPALTDAAAPSLVKFLADSLAPPSGPSHADGPALSGGLHVRVFDLLAAMAARPLTDEAIKQRFAHNNNLNYLTRHVASHDPAVRAAALRFYSRLSASPAVASLSTLAPGLAAFPLAYLRSFTGGRQEGAAVQEAAFACVHNGLIATALSGSADSGDDERTLALANELLAAHTKAGSPLSLIKAAADLVSLVSARVSDCAVDVSVLSEANCQAIDAIQAAGQSMRRLQSQCPASASECSGPALFACCSHAASVAAVGRSLSEAMAAFESTALLALSASPAQSLAWADSLVRVLIDVACLLTEAPSLRLLKKASERFFVTGLQLLDALIADNADKHSALFSEHFQALLSDFIASNNEAIRLCAVDILLRVARPGSAIAGELAGQQFVGPLIRRLADSGSGSGKRAQPRYSVALSLLVSDSLEAKRALASPDNLARLRPLVQTPANAPLVFPLLQSFAFACPAALRLAAVDALALDSVFANGWADSDKQDTNHANAHAGVAACLLAALSNFLDPHHDDGHHVNQLRVRLAAIDSAHSQPFVLRLLVATMNVCCSSIASLAAPLSPANVSAFVCLSSFVRSPRVAAVVAKSSFPSLIGPLLQLSPHMPAAALIDPQAAPLAVFDMLASFAATAAGRFCINRLLFPLYIPFLVDFCLLVFHASAPPALAGRVASFLHCVSDLAGPDCASFRQSWRLQSRLLDGVVAFVKGAVAADQTDEAALDLLRFLGHLTAGNSAAIKQIGLRYGRDSLTRHAQAARIRGDAVAAHLLAGLQAKATETTVR